MGDEQTVLDTIVACLNDSDDIFTMLTVLDDDGIDLNMTVARLRDDLAIAARVRACEVLGVCVTGVDVPVFREAYELLAFLLGDNP